MHQRFFVAILALLASSPALAADGTAARAAPQISIRPFCDASAGSMSVFTVIEGTTAVKGEKAEKDRVVFKATCDLTLSTCSIAAISLNNLAIGQPLDMLDVLAAEATVTRLGKDVYEIRHGLASVYTIDMAKRSVANRVSLSNFGSAKGLESLGVGRCD